MKKFLEIGSYGWQHPAWVDTFYPEELPEEWQLPYYANEFRFVLVPVQDWSKADEETLEQWRDDVHEQFRFMFELTPEAVKNAGQSLDALTERFADVLNGFVFRTGSSRLRDELTTLQQLREKARVFVDFGPGREPDEAERSLLEQHGLAFCWHLGNPENLQGAELALLESSDAIRDKRKLSAMMQAFLANTGKEGEFFLIFTGSPPPAQVMRDAVVISDLLGV